MSQIMRLRRRAGSDHHIVDRNNGERHERAITYLVRDYGLLHEAEMLPRSYGGYSWFAKFHPSAGLELVDSLPVITKALLRRKVTPGKALFGHKIPKDDLKQVKRIYEHGRGPRRPLRAEPVHLRLRRGRDRRRDRPRVGGRPAAPRPAPRPASRARARGVPHPMKVAYWPGCVSRGFTPELHGSMAKIAPLLDLELVELDRASCCGAGVIAEHNQELADTLNARTFALAQQVDGAELMMNICSTCQGAQTECQERLDANADYREHVNGTPRRRRPRATRRA